MNKLIALCLLALVVFTSHSYAAVSFKKVSVGKEKDKSVTSYKIGYYINETI